MITPHDVARANVKAALANLNSAFSDLAAAGFRVDLKEERTNIDGLKADRLSVTVTIEPVVSAEAF